MRANNKVYYFIFLYFLRGGGVVDGGGKGRDTDLPLKLAINVNTADQSSFLLNNTNDDCTEPTLIIITVLRC